MCMSATRKDEDLDKTKVNNGENVNDKSKKTNQIPEYDGQDVLHDQLLIARHILVPVVSRRTVRNTFQV